MPDVADYATFDEMQGVNINYEYLTAERVQKVHSEEHFIGLWYSVAMQTENEQMWHSAFTSGGGVDFFYSDNPLDAMQTRNNLQHPVTVKARL